LSSSIFPLPKFQINSGHDERVIGSGDGIPAGETSEAEEPIKAADTANDRPAGEDPHKNLTSSGPEWDTTSTDSDSSFNIWDSSTKHSSDDSSRSDSGTHEVNATQLLCEMQGGCGRE